MSTHFAEYALRFANSLAKHAEVLLILNSVNYKNEIEGLDVEICSSLTIKQYRLYTKHGIWPSLPIALFDIMAFKPDVIHIEEVSNPNPAVINILFRRDSLIVLRVHDPEFHVGDSLIPAWRLVFFGWMRRSANLILVHGNYCKTEFLKRYKNQNIATTIHGALLVPSRTQTMPSEPRRLLMFGRMEAYKGLDTLLAAAKILNNRMYSFTLHIAGRGSEMDHLKQQFEELNNVTIENRYLSPIDVIKAFQRASVVLLPYKEATQSGVLAAAFGNQRPVIATTVGGIAEIVVSHQNGLLVPPDSPEALANAVMQLFDDAELMEVLKRGAQTTSITTLNWSNIALETLHLYEASIARVSKPAF